MSFRNGRFNLSTMTEIEGKQDESKEKGVLTEAATQQPVDKVVQVSGLGLVINQLTQSLSLTVTAAHLLSGLGTI